MQENTLKIRTTGEIIQLEETSTGHLVLNMAKNVDKNKEELIKELFLIKKKKDYNMKDMKKIHRLFGHPSEGKMKNSLRMMG